MSVLSSSFASHQFRLLLLLAVHCPALSCKVLVSTLLHSNNKLTSMEKLEQSLQNEDMSRNTMPELCVACTCQQRVSCLQQTCQTCSTPQQHSSHALACSHTCHIQCLALCLATGMRPLLPSHLLCPLVHSAMLCDTPSTIACTRRLMTCASHSFCASLRMQHSLSL